MSNNGYGAADSIDVVELLHAIRRGWRQLVFFTVLGVVAAVLVILYAPRKFASNSSIVVRATTSPGASILSKIALPGGGGGGGGGDGPLAALGGSSSPLETEIQILTSRSLVEQVVDSLDLQVAVKTPRGIPTSAILSAVDLSGSFKQQKYHGERTPDGHYQLTGNDTTIVVTPGTSARLPVGSITVRPNGPAMFDLVVRDREDAIDRARKSLDVGKAGGEVLRISYSAPDSITAAAVPNALISFYLRRRKSTDRGTNEHRVEFLTLQVDSVSRKLSTAEDALRRFRESSRVIDAETVGKLQLTRAGDLRKDLGLIDVERGALDSLLRQIAGGRVSPRELAAYPSFLKSPAINELLTQLTTLETQRTLLLERRRETDDSVMALGRSIAAIDKQLGALGNSYRQSLDKQRTDITSQMDSISTALGTFPVAMEASARLQREVLQLAQQHSIMQASLADAKVAAIGEGGDVKQLDVATPPKKPAFPAKVSTLAVGLGGGLFLGAIFALMAGLMGRWIDDPIAIERTAGVPALRMDGSVPLLMSSAQPLSNTLLLVPLDGRANTAGVAERLARTALARALEPTVLDLSGQRALKSGNGSGAAHDVAPLMPDVGATIRRLESEFSTVIVRLPGLASDETAAALNRERPVLLVAPPGRVDRRRLLGAIQTLRRLDVQVAGVVVNRSSDVVVRG